MLLVFAVSRVVTTVIMLGQTGSATTRDQLGGGSRVKLRAVLVEPPAAATVIALKRDGPTKPFVSAKEVRE